MGKLHYCIVEDCGVVTITRKSGERVDVLLDLDDLTRLVKLNVSIHAVYSAKIDSYYIKLKQNGKNVYLHRWVMSVADRRVYVDHRNHNTMDNRKENLRLADNSANMHNRRGSQKNSKSGLLGVCWDASKRKWLSRIAVNGKEHFIGRFDDKYEAHAAYMEKKKEMGLL